MPSCAVCHGVNCPKKMECFRYIFKPDNRIIYCDFENICGAFNNWAYFYEIDGQEINDIEEGRETTEELKEITKTTKGE